MTVTIPSRGGFELEVVTQISNVQAGLLAAGDANGAVSTVGAIQFAFSAAETTSWTINWTPPATNVGSVVLYIAGGGQGTNYSNNFVMTPATAAQPPTITSFVAGAASITAGSSTTLTAVFSNGTGSINNSVGAVTSGTAVTVSPTTTTTYTLTVTSTTGTAITKTATVTVTAATPLPTITSFAAGAASITAGNSTTLTAVFSNGTGSVSNGVGAVTSGTAVTVSPATTTTYTLTVTPTTGTAITKTATVTVTPATTLPTISSFTVGAPSITSGNSTTLTAVFSNGTGNVSNSVGAVTSGTPVTIIPSATTTYTLTVTGASTSVSAQATVTVNPSTGTGTVTVTPSSLTFNYQMGGRSPSSKMLAINSTSGSTSYTAKETDPWLSISPTSGTSTLGTPGSIRASVNPAGMAAGSYGAQINITTQGGTTMTVNVALVITSGSGGCDDGCGGSSGNMYAQPSVSESQSGTLAAAWVANLGASPLSTSDPLNQGLVLSTSASSASGAWSGAVIQNVTGMSITELGVDFRASIHCSTNSIHFLVVTTDGKSHTVGGCTSSTNLATPSSTWPSGWTRLRFEASQASPAINSPVQSISIVLDKGSTSMGSIAVIDNIQVNGTPVGKGATSGSTSTSTSPTPTPTPTPTPRDN
jgi:hypothetical protein